MTGFDNTQFDRALTLAMAIVMFDFAQLDRTGSDDHAAAVIGSALDDRARVYPAWALIATASDFVNGFLFPYDLNDEEGHEKITADIPAMWRGAVDEFVYSIVADRNKRDRARIDNMIRTWGAVHAIDAAAVALREAARVTGVSLEEKTSEFVVALGETVNAST
jgi:hypothetical protein